MTETRSVFADVRPAEAGPRSPWWRRGLLAAIAVLVLLGAVGLLGVHSVTTSDEAEGYELKVRYAKVARAGLDVPFTVTVHRDAGFDGPVSIGVSSDYLRIYESQGIFPEPAEQSVVGDLVVWTFSPPPPGDRELVVDFDAYIQPSSQLGESATVAVLVDGRRAVDVDLKTWLVP